MYTLRITIRIGPTGPILLRVDLWAPCLSAATDIKAGIKVKDVGGPPVCPVMRHFEKAT